MTLLQDVKFGLRVLGKNPAFTAVMVAALALGIGVNATVFTLVNAVLLRGLPFEQPGRVMYLSTNNLSKNRKDLGLSYPEFRDWRAQTKTFPDLAAFSSQGMVIADTVSPPERYGGPRVTTNFFSLIGQKPMLGRDFLPEEGAAGAAPVCIIGYTIWENRYGRNPAILGQSIRVNDAATTIVGVMPKGMRFPVNADIWLPLVPTAAVEKRDARDLQVFGRLRDGVALSQARKEMELIAGRLEKTYPQTNQGITAMVIPYNDEFNGGPIRTVFLALLGAVGFVLLIACANVANLMLSRATARTREVSIRAALGAGRWRIVRQLLVESVVVAFLGGLGGLLIGYWGVRAFDLAVANVGKPYWIVFRMDLTVFAYLAGICLLTSVLFGLAPAIQLSKVNLNSTLKEGGRGSSGGSRSRFLSGFLVVTEVALSMVLLVGAGLMIRSFLKMYGLTSGFPSERMLTMRISLPDSRYPNADARTRFYENLNARLAALPGVESYAVTSQLPLFGSFNWKVELEGKPPVADDKQPGVGGVIVGPNYFQAAGIPVQRGRAFTAGDGSTDKQVAMVNQRFAAKYWPGEDPLGKRIRVLGTGERPWMTVVGVSQDVRQNNPQAAEIDPVVYMPYRARPIANFALLLRTNVAAASLSGAVRKEIRGLDGDLPVFAVATFQESLEQQRWPFRVFSTLFAVFALIALVLSAVGLYAVMAYSVSQRTQEIGLRMAMGASSGKVLRLVLWQGLSQLAIGLVIGLAAAFGLARVLKTLLVQVTPTDPLTFSVIAAVLIAVGILACWLPARWAMRVDPVVALRYE